MTAVSPAGGPAPSASSQSHALDRQYVRKKTMQRSSHVIINTAAVVLSLAASCTAYALTDRSAASGATRTATVTVDRTNKGDRLPQAAPPKRSSSSLTPAKRVPIGCEPAFSPVADPAGAHIFLRCLS
jgi:hypothetical protein